MRTTDQKKSEILIICGPPGSGKTTYVRERMWDGDLVWDWDTIMQAITNRPVYSPLPDGAMDFVLGMRERFCAIAAHCRGVRRVWVIVSARCPLTAQLEKLGAVILDLDTPVDVCRERLEARGPEGARSLEQYLART